MQEEAKPEEAAPAEAPAPVDFTPAAAPVEEEKTGFDPTQCAAFNASSCHMGGAGTEWPGAGLWPTAASVSLRQVLDHDQHLRAVLHREGVLVLWHHRLR